jgi:hypothetical protein
MRLLLALLLILASLWTLNSARQGVERAALRVGDTPVTRLARADADGPAVVVAHGFAGSRQMMQGFAHPLARAGYRVFLFDFLGHGRHPRPMTGDLMAPDGATRRLLDQTLAVIDSVDPRGAPVALLGHSMATDILARAALERPALGPLVLVSARSQVIGPEVPRDLLLIPGEWEPGLRDFALEAVRMVDPDAQENQTVSEGDVIRRDEVAEGVEHVSILHSRHARRAALNWLNRAYDRGTDVAVAPTGWAILGLLGGITLLFSPLARRLPARPPPPAEPGRPRLAALLLAPALAAPLVSAPLDPGWLPVLVAEDLALHLAAYGGVQLALLRLWKVPLGPVRGDAFLALLAWCALFGFALDRYAANFLPTAERLWIIAALAHGAVAFMLADARLAHGAGLGRRLAMRAAFLGSLGLAVALDPEGLFFLLMIAPVILLFFLTFGAMGRMASARSGPLAPGLALGLALAWALGVSFPLFAG